MKENEEKWLLELYFFYFRRKKYINNYINKYCWDFRFNYSCFSAWKGKKQFFQAIANKAWPLERALVFHSQWTNCSACVMGHREKEQWKSKKERDLHKQSPKRSHTHICTHINHLQWRLITIHLFNTHLTDKTLHTGKTNHKWDAFNFSFVSLRVCCFSSLSSEKRKQ